MVEADNQKSEPPESTFDPDWENRVLCSDESCIGVIGPDGHCRVCGKPVGPGVRTAADHDAAKDAEPGEGPTHTTAPKPDPADGDAPPDPDWENRVLCSDESCIGIIGPDGRCRVCGKPHVPPEA